MNKYLIALKGSFFPIFRPCQQQRGRAAERGVALVVALLLLTLITALSVGMVIAFSSQTLIGGFYRNYRGAFYAADSGLNVARQEVGAQLLAGVPTVFPVNSQNVTNAANCAPPLDSTVGASTYNTATSLNAGTAAQSWSEQFKISSAPINALPILGGVNTYSCNYTYDITSVGTASGSELQTVEEQGQITIVVNGPATPKNLSFAYFGAFVDKYPGGTGPLVPGTMTGPMFTNDAWEFMASIPPWTAPYIFTDPVGQNGPQVDYWDSGWGQHWVAGPSYGTGPNLVAPTFDQGLQLNQPKVVLAPNQFNQVEAVIDGDGTQMTPGQVTTGLTTLHNVSGSAYSGSQGVYYDKQTSAGATTSTVGGTVCPSNVTPPCIAGGGFYIEGGADVQLIPVSGSNTAQKYVITQGGVVTTITVDPAANGGMGKTIISTPTSTDTLNGVPTDTVTAQPSTMVYVDGTMYFHGPGEGLGAIQDNAMITLTANGDAIATGDVLYKTEPVTVPLDTLVPATTTNPMNQVLGIYTSTGSFITQNTQADQNIQVDGSIATILPGQPPACDGHSGGQLSYGHVNTINNVGGMIQSCIYGADVNAENTWFDRRFTARAGFAPPWFPQTTLTLGGPQNSNPQPPTFQRIQWLSKSSL